MAKRLQGFPGDHPSRERRYPWGDWADGSAWEIRQGDDYVVTTENMRVNLHMKADSLMRKVRTRKIVDERGEGLIFQFLESEDTERVKQAMAQDTTQTETAVRQLYTDAIEIYERARTEVDIPRSDGTMQKYAPVRYKRQIDHGYEEGALVPTVAKIIRKRTLGFGHLETAGRIDLMLETLVVDRTKPYHHLFTPKTVAVAQARLDELPS